MNPLTSLEILGIISAVVLTGCVGIGLYYLAFRRKRS